MNITFTKHTAHNNRVYNPGATIIVSAKEGMKYISDGHAIESVSDTIRTTGGSTTSAAQVNSDWNATTGVAEILNKPTIPAAPVDDLLDWDGTKYTPYSADQGTLFSHFYAGTTNPTWGATVRLNLMGELRATKLWAMTNAGAGVYGYSNSGYGVQATSNSSNAIAAVSTSADAITVMSVSARAIMATITPAARDTVNEIIGLERLVTNSLTAQNGIGGYISYWLQSDHAAFTKTEASRLITKYTDVTYLAEKSQFELYLKSAGTLARKLALSDIGKLTLDTYGVGTHTGTGAYALQVTAAGDVIEVAIGSGGGGSGTVTSVGLSLPSQFTVSGSPVTTTGTLTAVWANAAAATAFMGPTTVAGVPAFRLLAATDIPALPYDNFISFDTQLNGAAAIPITKTGSGSGINFIAGSNVTLAGSLSGPGGIWSLTINASATVTSVGLSLPSEFSVSGTPVTGSGTLTGTWASQTAKYVFAAPNGTSGGPSFRQLIASDIPTLEPALGNPSVSGYILSSTTAGVRSWIAPPTGGGGLTGSGTVNSIAMWDGTTSLTDTPYLTKLTTGLTGDLHGILISTTGADAFNSGIQIQNTYAAIVHQAMLVLYKAHGTGTLINSSAIGKISFAGKYTSTLDAESGYIRAIATGAWSAVATPTIIQIGVSATGTITPITIAEINSTGVVVTGSLTATSLVVTDNVVQLEQYICSTTAYTTVSQTALRKLFASPTNGALTVAASTTYFFECIFSLSALSTTSGSFSFGFLGTATFTSIAYTSFAIKGVLTAADPQMTRSSVITATVITAATTTATGYAMIRGVFRINASGTIIPSYASSVAAAAVVGVNSSFRCWPVGSDTVISVGPWA